MLLAERPRHGYDLRAAFEDRTGSLWSLNSGQVYTTLERLVRDGLATSEDDPDDDSGRRRLYSVTAEGRDELRTWLSGTDGNVEPQRDDLMMKVLLAAPDNATATAVIDRHRHTLLQRLQDLRRRQRDLTEDDLAAVLVADAQVSRLEADLHWLDRCEQRITQRKGGDR